MSSEAMPREWSCTAARMHSTTVSASRPQQDSTTRLQAGLAEELALGILGLGDAVGEQDEDVARFEVDRAFAVGHAREGPERRRAHVEPFDPAVRTAQQRWIVSGVAVDQASFFGVESGQEGRREALGVGALVERRVDRFHDRARIGDVAHERADRRLQVAREQRGRQSLARHVGDHQATAAVQFDEIVVVARNLGGRAVEGGDVEAGRRRRVRRKQPLLDRTRDREFLFEPLSFDRFAVEPRVLDLHAHLAGDDLQHFEFGAVVGGLRTLRAEGEAADQTIAGHRGHQDLESAGAGEFEVGFEFFAQGLPRGIVAAREPHQLAGYDFGRDRSRSPTQQPCESRHRVTFVLGLEDQRVIVADEEFEGRRMQQSTQSFAHQKRERGRLERVRNCLRQIVQRFLQVVLLAEEAPLQEALDAFARRCEGRRDQQRGDDRHELTVLARRVEHDVSDQHHEHEVGADHQTRQQREDQRPPDEHLDVHQAVARDRVTEAHRHEQHGNRAEQREVLASEQLAERNVEDEEGQRSQHRSQRQELHALTQRGVAAGEEDRHQAAERRHEVETERHLLGRAHRRHLSLEELFVREGNVVERGNHVERRQQPLLPVEHAAPHREDQEEVQEERRHHQAREGAGVVYEGVGPVVDRAAFARREEVHEEQRAQDVEETGGRERRVAPEDVGAGDQVEETEPAVDQVDRDRSDARAVEFELHRLHLGAAAHEVGDDVADTLALQQVGGVARVADRLAVDAFDHVAHAQAGAVGRTTFEHAHHADLFAPEAPEGTVGRANPGRVVCRKGGDQERKNAPGDQEIASGRRSGHRFGHRRMESGWRGKRRRAGRAEGAGSLSRRAASLESFVVPSTCPYASTGREKRPWGSSDCPGVGPALAFEGESPRRTLQVQTQDWPDRIRALLTPVGPRILDALGNTGPLTYKEGREAVTAVDGQVERILVDRIRADFPDHAVEGEEHGRSGPDDADTVWHVDPIDGTLNYALGIGVFCVSVGVVHDGAIVAGAILEPLRGDLYVAARGQGAWRNDERLAVSTRAPLREAIGSFQSSRQGRFVQDARILQDLHTSIGKLRRLGSVALELAFVASGAFDVLLTSKRAPQNLYDVAAGILLVEEAGGRVTDGYGHAFREGANELVASNGHVHDETLALLAGTARS